MVQHGGRKLQNLLSTPIKADVMGVFSNGFSNKKGRHDVGPLLKLALR
jgi:hypothetical protein